MSAIMQPGAVKVRPMLDQDLVDIMAIETEAYRFPWTLGIFRDCLRVGYFAQVLEQDEVILGYAVMSEAVNEAHILNICVRPDMQGQGLGQVLIEHLISAAKRMGAEVILLEVRPSNRAAVKLYQRLGFCEVGTRKAYYPDDNGREDAIILARQLS